MKASRWFLCLAALAVFTNFGSPARAAVVVASPAYPPIGEDFLAAPGTLLAFAQGVELSNLVLRFSSVANADTLVGDIAMAGNPVGVASGIGSATVVLVGRVGNATGTFDTEMLSMNLSFTSPIGAFMIRESPTKQSLGQTTITDIGGGLYHIDSFFDVFTELSLDGGQNWAQQISPAVHFELGGPVPEPTALGLLGLSLLGVGVRRSRRQV